MIRLSADLAITRNVNRTLALFIASLFLFTAILGSFTEEADAAAQTVTLKYGETERYGEGSTLSGGATVIKWVTHVDGEPIDLDDVAGVGRSYAYCVQPTIASADEGTFNVTVVDDDDTGKVATMRKLIYYLPGSYGYAKVTKKRWFANNDTGASDYAIGHIALSWIHANYSEGSEVWDGINSRMKTKCKSIVQDLKNLPAPPDSFEVFWVKVTGKQDIFGAFYAAEYGKATVIKTSANKTVTDGNPGYSLSGAQYTFFEDAACSTIAKTKSGDNAIITTKADGSSDPIELETDTYYVKETKAPPGYAIDNKVNTITVINDKTTSLAMQDKPKTNPVGMLIQKLDKETGLAHPQGAASLEGAEYTVKYYAVAPSAGMSDAEMGAAVSSKEPATINGKKAVWVFKTDELGKVDMSQPDKYLISEESADFYRNGTGAPAFPIGIISVTETKAPKGYLKDDTVRYAAIYDSGTAENLNTLKTFTDDNALKEQVIRGDISLSKAAEGRRRMEGVMFSLTSLTNGEKHIMVSDKNGFLCTAASWNPHDADTNRGESAEDGLWFNGYNDESTGAKPNNSLGALPYDTYLLEEIRSDANKGYDLISDEISIERNGFNLDLGTYDDAKEPEPKLETKARDDVTETNKALPSEDMLIIDNVEYSNLRPGKTYEVSGILMDKETGQSLLDDSGNEILGRTEFYADKENGNVEVEFAFSGASLEGKSGVVFETLKLDGKTVAEHKDINNKKQTVLITSDKTPEPNPEPEPVPGPDNPPKGNTPDTGDVPNTRLICYLISILASLEMLLLTVKHRNDRLN